MKKKLRLKWLTISAFALGAITVLPIVATACSSNDSSTSGTDTGGSSGSDTGSSSGSDTGSTTGSDTGGSSGGDTGGTTSGTTSETTDSTDPVVNPTVTSKYVVDNNTMTFAGYYGNGTGSSSDMNAIVKAITPSVSDVTTDSTGTWVNSGQLPDSTSSGNTYTRYTLTMDSDFAYVKNFINLTKWYNESSVSVLAALLDDSNVNYDVLANWNVSLVLNMYSDSSYQFVYTVTPKDSSSNATTYQFVLYTEDDFINTFTNGNRGDVGNYPVDNLKYTANSKVMSFAGYYGVGSADDMNAIVETITPSVSDVTSSDIWTKGTADSGDTTYTLKANSDGSYNNSSDTTAEDTYQYIENFVKNAASNSGYWQNVESSGALSSTVLSTDDVDYNVLSNYDISLVLDEVSDTSYSFTLTITSHDESAAVSSYVFTLYTQENYYNTFKGLIYDASGNYDIITDNSASTMDFAGDSGAGSTDNMNAIVAKITPSVTDVTTDSDTNNGGTGVWSAGVENSDKTATTYTLDTNGTSDNAYQYIENFINNAATWYNESSTSSLDAQLALSDIDYNVLNDYNVSLILNVYSSTSYQFVLSITPTSAANSTTSYQFILYTKYTFANTFPNGSRGAVGNYFVDDFLNQYTVNSSYGEDFAGYYGGLDASATLMNQIVTKITPSVSDVTDSSLWTKSTGVYSSGSTYTTYTLNANADGTYNDGQTSSDAYQYIENFINLANDNSDYWKSVGSDGSLGTTLSSDATTLDYDVLSNYNISLVITVDSSPSSYLFTCTITPKNTASSTNPSYEFTLYTQYKYNHASSY